MSIYFIAFLFRGFRWKYLLMPIKELPGFRLAFLVIIGFFMNNLLPLRLGEFVRAKVAGQKLSIPIGSTFATIVLERLFDGLTYVFLFLTIIMFLPFPEWAKKSMFFGGFLFIGSIAFLFFLATHQDLAVRLLNKIPIHSKWIERLENVLINFIKGLSIFSHLRLILIVSLLSICVWTVEGTVFLTFTKAFGLNLNLFQCFFVMIMIGMGAILPPAPGYVGTVEFLGVTALSFIGVDKNQGFGMIVTLHFVQISLLICFGIISLIKEKITFHDLIRFEKSTQI